MQSQTAVKFGQLKKIERMLEATEIEFGQRATERSRLERITNRQIGKIVQVTDTIADEIKADNSRGIDMSKECLKIRFRNKL